MAEEESLTIANSGRGVWAVGGVIILLCRLDIALLPVPLLQNPVAVCDRHNSKERRDNGCILEGFSPCFAS